MLPQVKIGEGVNNIKMCMSDREIMEIQNISITCRLVLGSAWLGPISSFRLADRSAQLEVVHQCICMSCCEKL